MRRAAVMAALAACLLAMGACGKKGDLKAPDDAQEPYTYPRVYPKPSTVVPGGQPAARPRSRERPTGAGDISPFPKSRRTTTYGDPVAP